MQENGTTTEAMTITDLLPDRMEPESIPKINIVYGYLMKRWDEQHTACDPLPPMLDFDDGFYVGILDKQAKDDFYISTVLRFIKDVFDERAKANESK